MSSNTSPERQRWLELLAGNSIGDLSPKEEMELKQLDGQDTSSERHEFECVAASLAIALTGAEHEPMPNDLRAKLHKVLIAQDTDRDRVQAGASIQPPAELSKKVGQGHRTDLNGFHYREMFAWLCLAASLLIAVGLWFSKNQTSTTMVTVVQRRASLIEQAKDLIQVKWTDGKTPFASPVIGDVTWSTAKQEGYMRFTGMPRNDPAVEQYQLWIIDPLRDDEPIDGGVFDIRFGEEHVVPITAKLAVLSPKAFAITIEKPGGVVVSTQERLPLLAAVP